MPAQSWQHPESKAEQAVTKDKAKETAAVYRCLQSQRQSERNGCNVQVFAVTEDKAKEKAGILLFLMAKVKQIF